MFDACRSGGRSSAAVLGDQHLVGVMGATTADTHWPPDGDAARRHALDAMGYVDDHDTIVQIVDALDAAPDLSSVTSTGPIPPRISSDPTAKAHWPGTARPMRCSQSCANTSSGTRRSGSWCPTTTRRPSPTREPVDLQAEIARRGLELFALPEGSASLVCGEGADQARAGSPTSTASRAPPASLSLPRPPTRSSAAWSGANRARVRVHRRGRHAWAPTAGLARARRWPWSPVGTPRSNRWPGRCATRRSTAADWAPTIAALLDVAAADRDRRALVG